jgi:hypothetical protein
MSACQSTDHSVSRTTIRSFNRTNVCDFREFLFIFGASSGGLIGADQFHACELIPWRHCGRSLTMTSRLIGFAIVLLLAVAAIPSFSACDPCASCAGEHKPPPPPPPNACLPSSSVSVLVQSTNATAYVPEGSWGGGMASVDVVPIETSGGVGTGGPPVKVATGSAPNSCSSNSTTGETVCVANTTEVYLINGTTLSSTLNSGATALQHFSGGSCQNCGVVVDSTVNKALITIGLGTGGPGGFQFLDLGGTPTFEAPIPAGAATSEDVSVDPVRKFVLSPNEQSNYQILNTSTGALFNNPVGGGPTFDSAAEDCTTGIALATDEFTSNLYLTDLTQAVFTPGSPGTWTSAGSQFQNFPDFSALEFGTNGIAVAPSTHLAIVTGEFGGNIEGVVQLPSTSGSGVPTAPDWVVFTVPNLPNETAWSQGADPHTVTAYVSPNSGKAFGLLGDSGFTFLAVVDLQGLLSAPRTGHVVNEPLPAGLVTFIPE